MFRALLALCVAAVLTSAALAQTPNIPAPVKLPPLPTPQVNQPPAQRPERPGSNGPNNVGTTLPTGSAQTTGTGTNTGGQTGGTTGTTGNGTGGVEQTPPPANLTTKPDLDACSPALERMLGVMFFELLLEFVFAIVRFLINTDFFRDDDNDDLLKLTIARSGYLLLVVPLNVSVLWLGSGAKSSCLAAQNEIRVVFALLIFYAIFVGMLVLLLLLEMKAVDDDSYDSRSYSDEYDPRRRRRRRGGHSRSSSGPPSGPHSDGHDVPNILRIFGMRR